MSTRAQLLELRRAVEAWPAERFDYRDASGMTCGCVLVVASATGVNYKDASWQEKDYIAGYECDFDKTAKVFTEMGDDEATGEAGKREALRRIDVVLARYPEEA